MNSCATHALRNVWARGACFFALVRSPHIANVLVSQGRLAPAHCCQQSIFLLVVLSGRCLVDQLPPIAPLSPLHRQLQSALSLLPAKMLHHQPNGYFRNYVARRHVALARNRTWLVPRAASSTATPKVSGSCMLSIILPALHVAADRPKLAPAQRLAGFPHSWQCCTLPHVALCLSRPSA